MKVIYGIGKVKHSFRDAVLAIGVFDGVHKGHQELIDRAVKKAKDLGGETVVLTFDPHPVQVLNPEKYLPLISTLPERISLIQARGVDCCFVVHFTKRFSQMSPENFVKRYILHSIRPKEIFVGCDFRFGNNRAGSLEYLKESGARHGFNVNILHSIEKGNEKISSTQIRHLVHWGKLKQAATLLGRRYSLAGIVEKGESRGSKLGFPTANLYPLNEILPPFGVYAVRVYIGNRKYKGMANVGLRPTFNANSAIPNVEVHLFNFKQNLVGKIISVEFFKKIRSEKKFSSKEKLIQQLKKDEKHIKSIF